jgi:tetratricopeptide (TPR) repeat protein
VKGRERNYGRDEVIFREGDPSDSVYMVAKGAVELSKAGPDGPIVLARVGPLEMFGEMGILDGSPRSATARASRKSMIKVVPREDFLEWLQQEPNAAIRVIAMLVDRLRAADEIIAAQHNNVLASGSGRTNVWSILRSLLRGRLAMANPVAGVLQPQQFLVGVATLNNDIEGAWTRALLGLFEGRQGLIVRGLSATLQSDSMADQVQANAAVLKARQLLGREEILDLLIWGDVHSEGYTLCFTPSGNGDDERPGSLGQFFRLELTGDQDSSSGDLLYLAALTAIEPLNDSQRALLRQLLPAALQALPPFPEKLPVAWTLDQQRTALTCVGQALAANALLEAGDEGLCRAAEVYRAATQRLPRNDHGLDEALLRKYRGIVLQTVGDRRQDAAFLEQAVEEFRTSAECLVRAQYPQEWGAAQNRLGLALYKLDLLTGQPALLKEALVAFQSALQVFVRAEVPQRWADVMNNLGQVLQVYGDQVKSTEVLERAVEACRNALEFRVRARTPLAWASSQNTLGSALFLLDKHRQSTEHLDEAASAFNAALEVFRQLGANRQAAVAEKNLAHAERLKKIGGEHKVAFLDWANPER